ncbi:development-specific protein LVN1.2-like [Amphiura filiformis]|uniref:development-specific protein LVN1.2-like n=1 Tax=Amphiura filiformis TaxID=82378 RepID=UPI003B2103EA
MDHRVAMLTCLMALLPAIIAQHWHQSNTTAPERCCFPASQFTIRKSTTSGTVRLDGPRQFRHSPLAILEESHEFHDYNNSRVAADIIRRFINGYPEQHIRIVEDLEEETLYIIYPYEEKCTKGKSADYPYRAERCISEHAEYAGNATIDEALSVDSWQLYIPEKYTNGYHSITVGRDSCLPLSSSFAGVSVGWDVKQHLVTSTVFYNYEEGLTDDHEEYFAVPDYCAEKPRKNGGSGRPGGRPDGERPSKGRKTD